MHSLLFVAVMSFNKLNLEGESGWLVIDKPVGISSFAVISRLKRLCKFSRIGHAGTLDPFASGVLLIGIGKATKFIEFAMDKAKAYSFTITFGENRDTLDVEGEVIKSSDARPLKSMIEKVLSTFLGEIEQVPPQYSAIKINGERAYKKARNAEEFTLPARKVILNKLELVSFNGQEAEFYIECGRGFYVRSLARDICELLGVCGFVSSLRREEVGKFSVGDAISVESFENIVHNLGACGVKEILYPADAVLDDILVHAVSKKEAEKLSFGQAIASDLSTDKPIVVKTEDEIVAICRLKDGRLLPQKVLNILLKEKNDVDCS